jgi:electron transport complex protein RnfE
MIENYKKIIQDGLWDNNPGLVQLLGLCPLMAVTTNTINGLGLAIATFITLVASNLAISLVRNFTRQEIRIPVFILIIASNVTIIELLMRAFFHDLYNILGIFIPLIVTNCIIIGRAEAFASRNNPAEAWLDGVMMGIGFGAVLVVLGAMREIFASGTLLSQAHLMFGEAAKDWVIVLSEDYKGFLFAALPPGAFMGLGFLLAGKNWIDKKRKLSSDRKMAQLRATPEKETQEKAADRIATTL